MERLLQSVALLNASMQQRIEQGRGDFHRALLHTLQPHYLRPVPACGIIQVETSLARLNEISSVTRMPRGTILRAGANKFTTAYDLCVAPIAIVQARFQPTLDLPAALRLPVDATSALIISLESTAGSVSFDQPPLGKLRICIDGEPVLRAALQDAILMQSLCTCLEYDAEWKLLAQSPFALAGTSADESLLPAHPGQQSMRLLSELFHMPQKFSFIDLDLAALATACPPGCKRISLHIVLPASTAALRQASAKHFRLACAPVINLFPQAAAPIRLDGRSGAYPLAPSQPGCEIYSVNQVAMMSRSGDNVLPPFHGTEHTMPGPYWQLDEQEGFALKFVDREQRPVHAESGTITAQLTCTNTEPSNPRARLTTEAGAAGFPIQFLQAPGNPGSISEPGPLCDKLYAEDITLPSLRELLQLHGCKYAGALRALAAKPSTAWLQHPMGRVHMQGTEFTLLVDRPALEGQSIYVLAEILAGALADKFRENRFVQPRIATEDCQVLYTAAPRAGTRPLT